MHIAGHSCRLVESPYRFPNLIADPCPYMQIFYLFYQANSCFDMHAIIALTPVFSFTQFLLHCVFPLLSFDLFHVYENRYDLLLEFLPGTNAKV